MDWTARAGLTARGIVYLLIGALALLIDSGTRAQADQKGALTQLLAKPYGHWLVILLAVGFAAYAVWRLSEAAFGVTGEGQGEAPRLKSLARGLIYVFLAYTAVTVLQGSNKPQSTQQRGYAAQVLAHPWGRWALALVGIAVVIVGAVAVSEGLRLKFMRFFPAGATSTGTRSVIKALGRFGTVARGLVFALVGYLIISAGWSKEAVKAGGVDYALKTMRGWPLGGFWLALAGLGLIAFGIYGLAEARYRKV